LLFLGLLAVVFFALTGVLVSAFHRHQDHEGRLWFARGESDLGAGQAQAAIDDFRNALQFSRGDPRYHLRLIDALLAAQRTEEARAYLLTLWAQQPASGIINLQLARLAASSGNSSEARRYFNNSIYGVWEDDPMAHRLAVRLEFAQFLVREHDDAGAQADLITLAANAPRDPALLTQIGRLFLQAGNPNRALEQFHGALRLDPKAASAEAGAGLASFRLGDYRDAQRHLQRVVHEDPADSASADLLQLCTAILEADPFAPNLNARQRADRCWQDYQRAGQRLRACAQQAGESLDVPQAKTELQGLAARARLLRPRPSAASFLRDPDLMQGAWEWLLDAESTTAARCGPPTGADQALWYIARRRHEGSQ